MLLRNTFDNENCPSTSLVLTVKFKIVHINDALIHNMMIHNDASFQLIHVSGTFHKLS